MGFGDRCLTWVKMFHRERLQALEDDINRFLNESGPKELLGKYPKVRDIKVDTLRMTAMVIYD